MHSFKTCSEFFKKDTPNFTYENRYHLMTPKKINSTLFITLLSDFIKSYFFNKFHYNLSIII